MTTIPPEYETVPLKNKTMDLDLGLTLSVWNDPYNLLGIGEKTIIGIFILFCLLIGTPLHLGIISYERYGQDPQKRSLNNQLSAYFSWINIQVYWMALFVPFWRMIIGPVNNYIYWIWCSIQEYHFFGIVLIGIEIYTFKFLTIVVYKKMLPIMDDFMAMFLVATNMVVGYFLGIVSLYSQFNHFSETRFVGWPSELADLSPIDYNLQVVAMVPNAVYVFSIIITIQAVKWRGNTKDQSTTQLQEPDTISLAAIHQRYNKEMVSLLLVAIVSLGLIGITFLIGFTDKASKEKTKIIAYLTEDLSHPLFCLIIYPTLVYVQHPDLRQHVLESF